MSRTQNVARQRSKKRYLWAALALSVLMFVAARQSWLGGASLNDPRAAPRPVSPRSDLSATPRLSGAAHRALSW